MRVFERAALCCKGFERDLLCFEGVGRGRFDRIGVEKTNEVKNERGRRGWW